MRRLATGLMAAAALAMLATGAHAQDKRKVKIGTEGAYPPFNSIDTDGELVGFDIDIANALCAAANFECEFVVQDWDGIIPGLIAKKYDAIVASMSITDKRKEVVDFTNRYYLTPAKFVAAKGSDLEFSPEGLAGKTIGVQRATTHENFCAPKFPEADVRTYATQDEANADLVVRPPRPRDGQFGRPARGLPQDRPGEGFRVRRAGLPRSEIPRRGRRHCAAQGRGRSAPAFNDAIEKIRADGTYQALNEKYFDFDVYGPTS